MSGSIPLKVLQAHWLPALCIALVAASLIYLGAAVLAGSASTLTAMQQIGVQPVMLGVAVCLGGIVLRCLRWQMLLRGLGHRLPLLLSARIYVAGLGLSVSPGKVGETVRSTMLATLDVPVMHSLAAFVADRASDVVGVALLGALAGQLAGVRQPVLEALTVLAIAGTALLAGLLRSDRFIALLRARKLHGSRWQAPVGWLLDSGRAWADLWWNWRGAASIGMALIVYGSQAMIFAGFTRLLAPEVNWIGCIATFSNATLIGAASMLPGGLGAMESALAWQLRTLRVDWPQALAIVLTTRLVTLWVIWSVGLAMLASFAGWRPSRHKTLVASDASTGGGRG